MENPTAKIVEGSDGLLLEIDGQIVPNYDATMRPFEEGEVVTGHVVRIDHDEVLVDIGYKSEGVIPANELSIRKAVDPHDEVTLGEEVDALVLTKEDQDGRLIMSKKRARFEKAWRRIEAAAESGEPVEGTVIEVVKGGLIIDLGVRGFLPASLVDIRRVPNLDEYMGTQIECKVIELNRSRNNVVLSRRAVLEEERKEVRQQILDRLAPGLVVEGQISNIVDFGAFVDLDGIDGLIHISELSWSHVNHPSEVLEIGDTVQVKVLDIDRDRQRISLGLKQTQEDPWQRIVNTYNIGDELAGTVTKVVTFGAFVEILDGVEGLVHISELAAHHVENPREIVQPGDELRVKILEIDSERRRLSLSAKRVEGQVLPVRRIEPEHPSRASTARARRPATASSQQPVRPRARLSRRPTRLRRARSRSKPRPRRRQTRRAPRRSMRASRRRRSSRSPTGGGGRRGAGRDSGGCAGARRGRAPAEVAEEPVAKRTRRPRCRRRTGTARHRPRPRRPSRPSRRRLRARRRRRRGRAAAQRRGVAKQRRTRGRAVRRIDRRARCREIDRAGRARTAGRGGAVGRQSRARALRDRRSRAAVRARFGGEVFDGDGQVDRGRAGGPRLRPRRGPRLARAAALAAGCAAHRGVLRAGRAARAAAAGRRGRGAAAVRGRRRGALYARRSP